MELLSFISFILFLSNTEDTEGLELKTNQGQLFGKVDLSRSGRKFYSFVGIPYGRIPQRFMESVSAPAWDGLRDATMYGQSCLSTDDCLFVNIFTPFWPGNVTDYLPVMFWIHGGAFQFGSGANYGPEYFMDEDIILVTINYRLGVLGFFTLDIDEAPGNQGMKDMVLALNWTQENIQSFGGDKNRVTIFGESAGGVAVSLLILSPLTKGLFHGAISQSGTALCPWAFRSDVKQESLRLATRLGCEGSDEEVLDCMRHVGAYNIWMARGTSILPDSFIKPMSFIPTIERRSQTNKSSIFLPNSPTRLIQKGQFQQVPYILGNNKYETGMASLLLGMFSNDTIKDYIPYFAPRAFGYSDRLDMNRISYGIQKTYFENVDVNDSDTVLSKIANDRVFFAPTRISALSHSTKCPTYLYVFDRPGYAALVPFLTRSTPQHTDELTYEFMLTKPPYWGSYPIPKEHNLYSFSADLVHNWATFAKDGKPGSHWGSKEITWERVTESPKWLHINDESALEDESAFFQSRMDFWSKFYNT